MIQWIALVIAFTAGVWFGFFVVSCCMAGNREDRYTPTLTPTPTATAYKQIADFVWIKENADE